MKIEDKIYNEISDNYNSFKDFSSKADMKTSTVQYILNNGIEKSTFINVFKLIENVSITWNEVLEEMKNRINLKNSKIK